MPQPPQPNLATCPAPPSSLDPWPTQNELSDFNQWMANLGPRFAGTPPHDCLVDQIKAVLNPLVMTGKLVRDPIPARTFEKWEASAPSLTLSGGQSIPVSGYMPFCGLTSAVGVTAPLMFEKPGFLARLCPLFSLSPFKFKPRHQGKIVAVWIPAVAFPKWFLKFLSRNSISDFSNWAPYRRTITLELQAPCLNKAQQAGVAGVVAVLDMSADHAEKQYLPFSRPVLSPLGQGVPGVHVDCGQKQALKAHAQANGTATLVLPGAVDPGASSEHLLYTLPGANTGTATEEIILVQTHTDGPSAIEENGVMALIALIHHFAAIAPQQRPRTLKFLFATGHFVKEIEGAKDLIWQNPPPWLARTKASIAIEHLGTKEWIDDCDNGYRARLDPTATARDEPVLVFVTGGRHPLEALAANHLPAARRIVMPARRRMLTLKRKFFGEGQYVSCTGIPTLGYVPNPNYMFSYADPGGAAQRGHFEKLDAARMLTELNAFRNLIDELVTDPLSGWPPVTPDATKCKDPKSPC